ncbi:MAG: hypothetical protein HY289_08710 [Planctomycetes bacterium]|nr:hypothetical protein [Planctomycetota bacterium]
MDNLKLWYWRPILPILIGVWIVAIFAVRWFAPAPPAPQTPSSRLQPSITNPSALAGTPTCSARGCHGGIDATPNPDRCQQNEYMQWARDPHADAYRTLFSERSQNIAKHLGDKKAHEDPRCLACHTNLLLASLPQDRAFVQQERLFGVGCESCHGSATGWLAAHTAPDWRQKKSRYAMPDLADATVAARTCAGCHVGAPGRDVNHDLIAAGHPRLAFEYGTYQAKMPAHWRPSKKSDAHLWTVGQVVTAQAALELLAHRANAGPWPEFAEYDCFACHHSLTQPSARQAPSRRKPGTLPWGSWYFALTRDVAGPLPALDVLEKTMQKPLPDRKQVAADTAAVLAEMKKHHETVVYENSRKRILDRLRTGTLAADASWDSAEQLYLALHALKPSSGLSDLAVERAFAAGFDGPLSWPRDRRGPFQPSRFVEKLKLLASE